MGYGRRVNPDPPDLAMVERISARKVANRLATSGTDSASYVLDKHKQLAKIADAIIRRVLAEDDGGKCIDDALQAAYPFGESKIGRQAWFEALSRNARVIVVNLSPK
jgi:hypothetical protein